LAVPQPEDNSGQRRSQPSWARLPDERLLESRFCDLELKVEGTEIEPRIRQLYAELAERGLRFRPPAGFPASGSPPTMSQESPSPSTSPTRASRSSNTAR